jgi:hypothetical protein
MWQILAVPFFTVAFCFEVKLKHSTFVACYRSLKIILAYFQDGQLLHNPLAATH